MKNVTILATIILFGINLELMAQSIPIPNNNYHYYGPNTSWGAYLKVGGNGRGTSNASVVTTNGNLHLDSKNGNTTIINHYSQGNTVLNTQGGNVGIGTFYPAFKLDVKGMVKVGDGNWGALAIDGKGNNDWLLNAHNDGESFLIRTNPNSWSSVVMAFKRSTGNVGIGTSNPGSWKLAVNGNIRAKEVKVETGWSDFVFYKNYKLPTLEEVEYHIKEKGHLKDIPSEADVKENGIFLGEMDAKLLQKIEELTLYAIEQEKELKRQADEINELKALVKQLLDSKK